MDDAPQTGRVDAVITQGSLTTVRLVGEFDLATAPLIVATGREQIRPGVKVLTLDLSAVRLVDSTTVSGIARLARYARAAHVDVRLVVRAKLVATVVRLSGLDSVVRVIYLDDEEERAAG